MNLVLLLLVATALAGDAAQNAAIADVLAAWKDGDPVAGELAAYEAGCAQETAQACAYAAVVRRAAGERDAAAELFWKACAGGYWFSCNDLMTMGDPRGKPEMARRHRVDCQGGSGFACDQLGLYTDDPVERAWAFAEGCRGGRGPACYSAALATKGAERRRLYEAGCKLQNPDACTDIVAWRAAEVELTRARDACQRDARACRKAGDALLAVELSSGDERHDERATLYERGCDAQDGEACAEAGLVYARADRWPEAAAARAKACDLRVGEACDDLASQYRRGKGVPKNGAEAERYAALACAAGVSWACP